MYAPHFDPIAFSIGPLAVHWYGLMYLFGFAAFWLLGRQRARQAWRGMSAQGVEDLLFYGARFWPLPTMPVAKKRRF